jgi:hypothetical protein
MLRTFMTRRAAQGGLNGLEEKRAKRRALGFYLGWNVKMWRNILDWVSRLHKHIAHQKGRRSTHRFTIGTTFFQSRKILKNPPFPFFDSKNTLYFCSENSQ